jgi:hypothetical protein
MAFAAPNIDELFGGLPADQRLDRFESFKSAMSACHQSTARGVQDGSLGWNGSAITKSASTADRAAELRSELSKSYNAEQIADVTSALDRIASGDVQKDWSLTNPLNTVPFGATGMVPYNLDPALAMLVPRSFVLRNSTPRIGAVGQAFEFRRILGVSNSGTGGVANLNTFFAAGNSAQFPAGGLSLNRPSKISYASDRVVLSHKQQGVSDSVDMTAQFAGQGFTDLRQLSHTAAIWSHMLGEERNMANARSSALVFGAGTPVAAVDSGTLLTGLPAGAATVVVTPISSMGEGQGVAAGSITAVAGQGVKLTTVPALNAGTLGIATYVTITSGGAIYKGVTPRTDGTSPTTFVLVSTAPSTSTDNGSYSANAYDGYVQTLTGANSGYVKALNGALSITEPGAEFQDAFASLFASVIGDPDVIITTAAVRRSLAKAFQTGGSNGYRLNYSVGSDGATVGSVIDAVQNESTGKMLDVIAHPYLPAGVALLHTRSLPFPDSGVAETVQAVNVQDMLVIEWPQIQLGYDLSTYQYGTLAFRAPAWSAAITNISA